jgi:hypothetical protein
MALDKIFTLIIDGKPELLQYFPDKRDIHKLPRAYCLNVFYTLEGKNFYDFVQTKIAERNATLAKDQDLMIQMDPEVAQAFR